jgi:hypothetical protein
MRVVIAEFVSGYLSLSFSLFLLLSLSLTLSLALSLSLSLSIFLSFPRSPSLARALSLITQGRELKVRSQAGGRVPLMHNPKGQDGELYAKWKQAHNLKIQQAGQSENLKNQRSVKP